MSESEITEKQQAVLDRLPGSRRDIAEDLDISIRAVRYRQEALEEEGYTFERDSDGIWYEGEIPDEKRRDAVEPWRINSYSKAQATKDINNELTEIEKEIKEALRDKPKQVADFNTSGDGSTLVIPRSDDHFGVKVQGRSVNEDYSTPIARRRINYIVDHAIRKSQKRGDVEEVVLGLFGDHIDGENVYPGHKKNLDVFLREQIREVARIYINQVQKLSKEFDHVKIVSCPGNHGSLGDGAVSNADDIVYDQIELGVDLLGLSNVTVKKAPHNVYTEFSIRDWKAYARHGQDALTHASTSSGDDRWMNWKEDSEFDIAYHGHHHQLRMEPVGHAQLFQCGTLVPPSLFVSQIGATGVPRAFYHFTTDENLVEDMEIIDFS